MRVFAIGDVQGCAQSLDKLLEHIDFNPEDDRLWFAGDLVNRGPDSLNVLRKVKGLGDRAISVLGNHDLHLLALANGNRQKDKSNPGLDAVLEAPDSKELLRWLRKRPLLHHDADLGFTMIHAGLPPTWSISTATKHARSLENMIQGPDRKRFFAAMYGNKPERWDDKLSGLDLLRFTTNCLTRMRYISQEGNLDFRQKGAPGSQPDGLIPWFQHAGRASSNERIVCGHWSTLGFHQENNVYAIDTGCLWGGQLTALQLYPHVVRFGIPCRESF